MSNSVPVTSNDKTVYQRTLKRKINCNGIALHSGAEVAMTINPADENTGIVFQRTDIAGEGAIIPATWERVVDTRLCTVIGNDEGITVGTIEHLMAALAGCGIDNALVQLNNSEVPVMDGSAAPFVFLIECAGVIEQEAPRRVVRVLKAVSVREGDSIATLTPSTHLSLHVDIDFNDSVVAQQSLNVGLVNGAFCKELARARTFGFLHEVEQMRSAGLAKGGSLDNAVVVSSEGVINEEGLRFDDEFVRHKILDAVGDLYLAGGTLIAAFYGSKVGHAINNKLLRALFSDSSAWAYDTMREDEVLKAIDGGISPEISRVA